MMLLCFYFVSSPSVVSTYRKADKWYQVGDVVDFCIMMHYVCSELWYACVAYYSHYEKGGTAFGLTA